MLGLHFQLLHLGHHLIDTGFGLGLGQTGALGHQLRQVHAVLGRQRTIAGNAFGQDAGGHAVCCIFAHGCRAIATEQAIDEIAHRIVVVTGRRRTTGSRRYCGRLRSRAGTSAHQVARSAQHQHGRHQGSYSPGQEAMRGIAEIHFIAMQVGPFHPQPTGNVAAQARSDDLRQQQPYDGGNAQGLGTGPLVCPGGSGCEAQPCTKDHQDQGQGSCGSGASENCSPGNT
ncbi:hypothetical protein D3C81_1539790 [compost metagenome]